MAKHRSAAQKAATKRMLAARWGKKVAQHRAAPKRAAKRRRASKAVVHRNPIAMSTRGATYVKRSKSRSIRRAVSSAMGSNIMRDYVVPVSSAAAGALAVDVGVGLLPVDASLKVGPMSPLVKAVIGLGLGLAVGMVNKKIGQAIAVGTLTIAAHNAAKMGLQSIKPGMVLGEWEDGEGPLQTRINGYVGDQINGYVGDQINGYQDNDDLVGEVMDASVGDGDSDY